MSEMGEMDMSNRVPRILGGAETQKALEVIGVIILLIFIVFYLPYLVIQEIVEHLREKNRYTCEEKE